MTLSMIVTDVYVAYLNLNIALAIFIKILHLLFKC